MSISITTIGHNFDYFLKTRYKQSRVSSSTDGSSRLPKLGKQTKENINLRTLLNYGGTLERSVMVSQLERIKKCLKIHCVSVHFVILYLFFVEDGLLF